MALVFSNFSLEPYDGSRSQKSHDNVTRMLSMVYFHCKTIRNASNITVNVETNRSKIRPFRLQKSEKSPAKSCSDCFQSTLHLICFDTALCEEPHLSVMTLCDLPSLWNEWCIYIALFVYCCTPKELYQFTNFNINLWNSTSFFLNFNISISIYWKVSMIVFWTIAKSAVFPIIVVSKNKIYREFILYGWSFIETKKIIF